MRNEEGKYNIKAISTMLDIQPGTLRAWERRYKMISPVRNSSGHRLYTDEHVRIVKWLVEKINQNFTISQAVALLDQAEFEQEDQTNVTKDRTVLYQDELVDALLKFDENKAHDLINQVFSVYTIDKGLIEVLGCVLVRIGDLWENEKITTAHEHFATSILRSRIGILMHSFPHNGFLPKVVAVCAPGEWHELGLLIFTLFMRRKGFEVIYLGTTIKEGDLDIVLDTVEAKLLFLSCTMKENTNSLFKLIDRLHIERTSLVVGIGGYAIDSLSEQMSEEYRQNIVGQSKEQWEKWLSRQL